MSYRYTSMVGTLRRLAQSLVGASKTTSTSVPSVASRSMSERSAISTSWITLLTVPTRSASDHGAQVRLRGTADCPKVQRARWAVTVIGRATACTSAWQDERDGGTAAR